jgi:uracil-DNA glycosylase
MRDKPTGCIGCPLHRLGEGFSVHDGAGTAGVLVVAEALGEDEARRGIPLVGRAGQTWNRMVQRTSDPVLGKLRRDHFFHFNIIACRPPSNVLSGASYEHAAIAHCRRHLNAVVRATKPKVILGLGGIALRTLTGHEGIEQLRGYLFETSYGIPFIGTYHPSYIMRGKWNLARIVQLDILKALEVAREGPGVFLRDKAYELSPAYADVKRFVAAWRAAGRPPLAFDIETPHVGEAGEAEDMVFEDDASYQILMCSLAWEPFKAISVPWVAGLKELVIEALSEAPTTLVWNAKFDVPRLVAAGVEFSGEIIDAMLAWHWLEPALPMGLKYVSTFFCPDMPAWKLQMHKNFQWYNAADSDVLLRVFLGTRARLEQQGRWRTFMRHFVEFGKLLNRMTVRGVAIDHERREEARNRFGERFAGVIARAGSRAPGDIRPLHPKRGYAKTPKDTTGLVQITVELTPAEEARERKKLERERARAEKAKAILIRKAERVLKRAEKAARRSSKPKRKKKADQPVHGSE